jgi:K(+)-stimulated pyrophosphate-energized sodium pump
MIIASGLSYVINKPSRGVHGKDRDELRAAAHHPGLDHLRLSLALTFVASYLLIPNRRRNPLVGLSLVITCGTLAGAVIPSSEVFTSASRRTCRVVTASREAARR